MQTLIISGATASGVITPPSGLGVEFRNITINELPAGSGIVNISGVSTGVVSIQANTTNPIRFKTNEVLTLSTSNFTADDSALLSYVTFGDETGVYVDLNRTQLPLPSRLTRSPRNGS